MRKIFNVCRKDSIFIGADKILIMILLIAASMIITACGQESKEPEAGVAVADAVMENDNNVAVVPDAFMITDENYFDYQEGLECAAYASAYLLRHYGEEASGLELFKTFPGKIGEAGTRPTGIETFFTDLGYDAEFKCDGTIEELKAEVSKGAPVIVFIHVEEPYESSHNTHYIPIVGYDKEYFYFAESLSEYANCKEETELSYNRKTEISKFERLWENIDDAWDYPYFSIK